MTGPCALAAPAAAALIAVALAGAAAADADRGVCVQNQTGETLLFVAELAGAGRVLADLAPGETLCSGPGDATEGVIGVFENAEALEGCSWVLPNGGTEVLLEYASFDNCRWAGRE